MGGGQVGFRPIRVERGERMLAALAKRLNDVIRDVFAEESAKWRPETGDGLWVEARDDGLYLCDYNTAARLDETEATDQYIQRAAREWIEATRD